MICNISGKIPQEPVVNKNTGHVYEKRLILKYLEENNNTCPLTQESLTPEDLIPLISQSNTQQQSGIVRNLQSTSITSLLHLFQTEWDSIMLETFTLKQQLEASRKELSRALYQHDAACRVIARLLKEREQYEKQLQQQRQNPQDMQGIPQESLKQIEKHSAALVTARKQRRPSPNAATPDALGALQEPQMTQLLHGSVGVSCIATQDRTTDDTARSLWFSGGVDGLCVLFDRNSEQILAELRGHTKRVNETAFHPDLDILFSCSDDKTSRIWSSNENGEYNTHYTMKNHKDAVTGLSLHPTGDYYATSSKDASWSFYDVGTGTAYCNLPSKEPLSTIKFHPDGIIAATATMSGKVQLWNLKNQSVVATMDLHQGAINSLCFSENGFEMVTCSEDQTAKIIDLRKLQSSKTFEFDSNVRSGLFDHNSLYVALGVGSTVQLYQTKSWQHVNTLSCHSDDVTGIQFGKEAKSLVSCSLDRQIVYFQTQQ
uniref:Pre-mRNA-processing factor 19 n=1 Tax=Percolomonas cosmopolitus TaxID=63605 RepID=A0A7S1KUT8_9EUKA